MLFPEDVSCFQPSMWGLAKAVSSRKPFLSLHSSLRAGGHCSEHRVPPGLWADTVFALTVTHTHHTTYTARKRERKKEEGRKTGRKKGGREGKKGREKEGREREGGKQEGRETGERKRRQMGEGQEGRKTEKNRRQNHSETKRSQAVWETAVCRGHCYYTDGDYLFLD